MSALALRSVSPLAVAVPSPPAADRPGAAAVARRVGDPALVTLRRLEAESIFILREVAAELSRPVLLFSIGKDSMVLLHLARKAFHPAPLPFPLLHVDTGWKFREMLTFRDQIARDWHVDLRVHGNEAARAQGVNPFDHGPAYTTLMKTHPLKQALEQGGFDAAIGGARRDEERSRAKERVYSFRDAQHQWDPRRQRPELWRLYNGRHGAGESIRVFPLSNWTELDVWRYTALERLPVVPLYFAAPRPVVERDGTLIAVDDEARMRYRPGERPVLREVRFRTLGCWPLSGAIPSSARNLPDIICEMEQARVSERQGRLIDRDEDASMEKKKREGYF